MKKFYKNTCFFSIYVLYLLTVFSCFATEDIPKGTILIKNTYSKEFLYVNGNSSWVLASPGFSEKSIFTIEKNEEGYLIKNKKFGSYLYSCDNYPHYSNNYTHESDIPPEKRLPAFRTIYSNNNISSNTYFDIIKKGDGYVIKSTRHNDYVYISPEKYDAENHYVSANNYIHENGYFTFHLYDIGIFQ